MLELVEVSRRFGDTLAVDGARLTIGDGEMVGIIGRSGAGKSTLLRLINRLIDPSNGAIFSDGVDITALRGRDLRAWRARTAMIFQQFNLVGRLDVLTNVLCGRLNQVPTARMLLKLFTARERALAIRALDRLGLAEVAMNRADINRRDGITVLTNLHTLDTARTYCRRIIGMAQGRVVFDGTPEQLTEPILQQIYGHGDPAVALDERVTSTSLPIGAIAATAR